jgi:colanic acid/amylovoran biosynthesis protein WcaK/AmsJ
MRKKLNEINVLIVNIHSSLNAGDVALLESSLEIIKKSFGRVSFTLSPNWPNESYFVNGPYEIVPSAWSLAGVDGRAPVIKQIFTLLQGWVWAQNYARGRQNRVVEGWSKLFASYQKADLVVGVCGNQFFSTGRYGWPFPAKLLAVALAGIFKKPYYALPQTLGPLKRGWERYAFARVYSRARLILVRDQASLKLGRQLTLPEAKLHYVPDPGLFYSAGSKNESMELLKKYDFPPRGPALGISVISQIGRFLDEARLAGYYDAVSRAIIEFQNKNGGSIYLFNQVRGPTQLEDDRAASQEILKRTRELSGNIVIVEDAITPAQLKACYALMDIFIATRLHAGLLSLGAGTPTLFIGYLTKTRGVLSSLGLEELVVDLANLDADDLDRKLEMIWARRKEYKRRLAGILLLQKKIYDQCARMIKADYDEYKR